MNIHIIKHITITVCCLVLSHSAYAADDLYDSELNGLAYFNMPIGSNVGHASPTFGFSIGRVPTSITTASEYDLNSLLINPAGKTLFNVQYDLAERRWSRFAFGGINALVYDDVLNADGGGPTIDPTLLVLGAGFAGFILFVGNDGDDDDSAPPECTKEGNEFTSNAAPSCCEQFAFTSNNQSTCCSPGFALNTADPCSPSDMRLKRDIVYLVTLENGIQLYSFRYLWDDTVYVGVMAQDLLAHEAYRDAVVMQPDGFYAVHYEMLGLRMITLNEWNLNQDSIYSYQKNKVEPTLVSQTDSYRY